MPVSVLSNIVLTLALAIMTYGVCTDIRERRYPIQVFLSSVVLGFIYAYLNKFILNAFLAFVVFTLFGIWASDKHLMANGDLWCLSTLFLFIDITNYKQVIVLIVFLFIWSTIIGIKYKRNVIEDYKKGLFQVSVLFYKVYFPMNTEGMSKENTIPFTIILVCSLLCTLMFRRFLV